MVIYCNGYIVANCDGNLLAMTFYNIIGADNFWLCPRSGGVYDLKEMIWACRTINN